METEEHLCQEILDSVKECLWHKWDPTLQEERSSWYPTSTSRHDPQADYSTWNCTIYNWLKDTTQDSCKEALAVARDAHQQTLAATALLEEKIKRLSHSLSCGHQCSGSHRHLASHQWRSQTGSHQTKVPQVEAHQGESSRRWTQSPSPMQTRWLVTFEDSPRENARAEEPPLLTRGDKEGTRKPSDWSQPEARGGGPQVLTCPQPSHPRVSIRRRCTLGWQWNGGQPAADFGA